LNYQNTVLRARQEVEDGRVALPQNQERVALLFRAVEAAGRTLDLALVQCREGAADNTTVLTAQQSLLAEQDRLADSRGSVRQGLISVYRGLGGGCEDRKERPFIPVAVREEMGKRTEWRQLATLAAVQEPSDAEENAPTRAPAW